MLPPGNNLCQYFREMHLLVTGFGTDFRWLNRHFPGQTGTWSPRLQSYPGKNGRR